MMQGIRRSRRLYGRPAAAAAGLALLGLAACESTGGNSGSRADGSGGSITTAPSAARVADPDEFLVVDCMLPAQVRRLGSRMTYLGVRRPVRTSGLDCAIRGGEYVAYDRADYRTALAVWMEPAKAGDPEAQTYVGEILERGLGTPPDYTQAAMWYQRAADQGHAPAQINLGQLYEQGLGVEKDPVVALNWYRRAADFDQAGLTFVASADTAAEIDALRAQVDRSDTQAEQLRAEMQRLQSRIAQLSSQRAQPAPAVPAAETMAANPVEQERAEAAQSAMLEERQRLEQERQRAEAAAAELDRLKAELDRERRLLQAEDEKLQARLAEAASAQSEAEVERLAADLRARQAELAGREQALAQRVEGLSTREEELAAREAEVNQREAELEARLAALQTQPAPDPSIAGAVEDKQAELSALDAEIETLRDVFEEQRQRLEQLNQTQDIALAGPSITLVDPPLPEAITRGIPVVRTRAGVAERQIVGRIDAPAGILTLVVNDRVTEIEDRNLFRATVPVSDQGTRVSVAAIDRQGKRADLDFLIERAAAEVGAVAQPEPAVAARPVIPDLNLGQFHALVIGNNAYQFLPPLKSAINDARAVAEVLSEKYGFKVTLIEDADRYQILSSLNELRKTLTENDNLLIYYAGHGELDRTNMRGHWLPVDAEAESSANWISNVAVTDILNAMNARRVLVVADSCYSGALTRAAMARLESGMDQEARLAWLKAMADKRSRTALTSGGLAPTLDGGGGDHSVFARAFLDVLEQNDGLIEGQRLFQEISARVTYAASKFRFEQLPQYAPIKFAGHEAGEFFFRPEV